jgi:hypothetical protein
MAKEQRFHYFPISASSDKSLVFMDIGCLLNSGACVGVGGGMGLYGQQLSSHGLSMTQFRFLGFTTFMTSDNSNQKDNEVPTPYRTHTFFRL